MVGRTLAHFKILSRLGEGGMGVVYAAEDTRLGRRVAIKVLPPDLVGGPARMRRFQQEARTAAALNHPNIATLHEVGEADGFQFIVMELIEGKTLREVMKSRSLPLRDWLRIALAVSQALVHAHRHGVVHRDLKPDNVMITLEGQVKLLDFGLAKLLEPESTSREPVVDLAVDPGSLTTELTRPDRVPGTAAYMSPEQARGREVDHRSDIFSLGIMLYEMAAGQRPFRKPSAVEILHAIIHEDPPALGLAGAELTPDADRIVKKCLEKEPGRRYQHADEIVTDLKNVERDLQSGTASLTTAALPPVSGTISRLRRAAPWGAAAVAVAALAAAAFLLARGLGPAAGRPAADRPVGVVGFENLSDSGDEAHLGRMLMSLITTDLAETGGLTVVSTARVLSALGHVGAADRFDASLATDAAVTAGMEVMLTGSIAQDGPRLVLTAQLVDVERGTVMSSFKREAGSRTDLFRLAGEIAAAVRRIMGAGAAGAGSAFDLASALTSSTEAYRHFAAGEVALHQRRWPDAIQQFVRATREDPTFALAWYRLSMAQWWQGTQGDAIDSIERGLEHVDRLPPRWRVVYLAFRDYQNGRPDEAYGALSELVESSPRIADAWYILGEIRSHFTGYRDSLQARREFERTLEIDPTFKSVFFHLIDDYVHGLDLDGAASLLAEYRRENPGDPAVAEAEAALSMARGELDQAERSLRELLDRGQTQVLERLAQVLMMKGDWGELLQVAEMAESEQGEMGITYALGYRAQSWLATGRMVDGIASLRTAVERMDSIPGGRAWLSGLMAYYLLVEAQVLEAAGEMSGALAAARRATRVDPLYAAGWGRVTLLEESMGRPGEARRALAELERLVRESKSPLPAFSLHLLRAERALRAGDAAGAGAELALIEAMPPEHRDHPSTWELRARIHMARGEPVPAAAAYDQMFLPLHRYPWARPVTETLALSRRGLAREAAGDREAARRDFRELLRRWGDADMTFPQVALARERVPPPGS